MNEQQYYELFKDGADFQLLPIPTHVAMCCCYMLDY